jgi:hypothetical protein
LSRRSGPKEISVKLVQRVSQFASDGAPTSPRNSGCGRYDALLLGALLIACSVTPIAAYAFLASVTVPDTATPSAAPTCWIHHSLHHEQRGG